MTLNELKADLLADGIIDADEVARLKEVLYEDGVIDKEEADFLFEINDAVTGKDNDPAWEAFFIQAIADFLLKDDGQVVKEHVSHHAACRSGYTSHDDGDPERVATADGLLYAGDGEECQAERVERKPCVVEPFEVARETDLYTERMQKDFEE